MHHYGRKAYTHNLVLATLGALGVAAAYGLPKLLSIFNREIPPWFDSPATLGFFGLFYIVWDHWLWRTKPFLALFRDTMYNLAGTYRGDVKSSFNDTTVECTIEIRQTYGSILVVLHAPNSSSSSTAGTFCLIGGSLGLNYVYRNEPNVMANNEMHMHYGLASIYLDKGDRLHLEYFTGRDRMTYGGGTLTRITS